MFYASLYGKNTDSVLPLLNLLELLTVENIFTLRRNVKMFSTVSRSSKNQFSHQWHKKQLPSIFDNYFRYASDVHT